MKYCTKQLQLSMFVAEGKYYLTIISQSKALWQKRQFSASQTHLCSIKLGSLHQHLCHIGSPIRYQAIRYQAICYQAIRYSMNYWLVKSEPFVYGYDDLERDGRGTWDGVRNYQARNNLQAMQTGDLLLFYHSNEGLAVVGLARVVKAAYPDPTTEDLRWVVVDVEPFLRFKKPVTLQQIKADNRLANIALIRQSRLSVMPIRAEEFGVSLNLGNHEIA